jgi:hypothetical protein
MLLYSFASKGCVSSSTALRGMSQIEDGESSDPLILCLSSTSILVGRGGQALPLYSLYFNSSVVKELLRPAMDLLHASSVAKAGSGSELAPVMVVDGDPTEGHLRRGASSEPNIGLSKLIPKDIIELAQGESLVVTYPLAWSHTRDGDEMELLSSFVFSSLKAESCVFVASPLAAAYGWGIGLKEGDEGAAKRLYKMANNSTATKEKEQGDCPPGEKTELSAVGSKRQRDDGAKPTSSTESSSSTTEDDDTASSSDDSDGSVERSPRKNHHRGRLAVMSSKLASSKHKKFSGRLLVVQIDATSITVSHVAMGSVQRFIKVSLGIKERALSPVDATHIKDSLDGAMASVGKLTTVQPAIVQLQDTLREVGRVTMEFPSLTAMLIAARDLTLSSGSVDSVNVLSEEVHRLCRLQITCEDEEDDRCADVVKAVNALCTAARDELSMSMLASVDGVAHSCPLVEVLARTGAVGNAISKLEAKLDDEDDVEGGTSLISIGGEVVEWMCKSQEGAASSQKIGDLMVATLRSIVESAQGSEPHRRVVLLQSSGEGAPALLGGYPMVSGMVEFQGASLVASISEKDFVKLSMTAEEYTEKGAGYIRWRCAR